MGTIALELRSGQAVANDAFIDRFAIPDGVNLVKGSNVGATSETGEPVWEGCERCAVGRSVWWSWTATANGTARVDASASAFSAVVSVFTGNTLPTLNLVGREDDSLTFFVTVDSLL
jgi:hypothetical protein